MGKGKKKGHGRGAPVDLAALFADSGTEGVRGEVKSRTHVDFLVEERLAELDENARQREERRRKLDAMTPERRRVFLAENRQSHVLDILGMQLQAVRFDEAVQECEACV